MSMLRTITIILYLVNSINFSIAYIDNEQSLREDLIKLFEGKLKFSEFSIPFYNDELSDITLKNHSEYDFIVVGAGSAGSTIASRLSELSDATVLLIEAGTNEHPIMDIPKIAAGLQFSDEINWMYETESSDKYCLGSTNNRCLWPRGKVMGGSSILNFMLATRASKRDFNEWAEITGDKSWSYEEMLKYMKKLEEWAVDRYEFNSEFHNTTGPVYITSPPFNSELGKAFINAGKELGFPEHDYNGADFTGFSYLQTTIKNGERWSANRAYLQSIKNRNNLFLSRNSLVTQILINEELKKAEGVRLIKADRVYEIKSKKEVVICAGSINSPQLLMLSGIGPAEQLKKLNINVVKDSPVGENLMDHVGYSGLTFKVNDSATFNEIGLFDPENPSIKNYINDRSGILSMGIGLEALGFINADNLDYVGENNTIELLFAPVPGLTDSVMTRFMGISEEYRNKMTVDKFNHSAWTIFPLLMKPKSRGRIVLKSKNPYDKPLIYPNYFDNPEDIQTLIKGIRAVLEISKTKSFQKYGSKLYDIPLSCGEFNSDEYWECAIRTFTCPFYHPVGTCKMGNENDKTAVVNSELKVIGIKNLRIADGSIMPNIISAHANIPIISIGEKLADMIKKDWSLKKKPV